MSAGCATYTAQTSHLRSLYRAEKFDLALDKLETSTVLRSSENRLLYYLEKGSILDRMGQRSQGRLAWMQADRLIDELFTVSASKVAASFVTNDSVTDYEGEDFEKVAVHLNLALSFLEDDQLNSARVEARRINMRLKQINQSYDQNSKNRYSEDAFARYLSGMIYESLGEYDNAIVDYRSALKIYDQAYRQYFSLSIPQQLVRALHRLLQSRGRKAEASDIQREFLEWIKVETLFKKGFGELVVIHELGHIWIKRTEEMTIPFGNQIVRFSFPSYRREYQNFLSTGVQVGSSFHSAETVQDLNAIASVSLDDRRGRMLIKHGARLLAKGQLVEQTRRNFGPLAGLLANIGTAVSETADTRSWASLPARYTVTRIPLAPGHYQVQPKTNGRQGNVFDVVIKDRKLSILRVREGQ